MTIKAHFLLHCCLVRSSPRKLWCYRGEDLMGKMRRLGFSSSKGAPPWQAGNKGIQKYCIALDMAFKAMVE